MKSIKFISVGHIRTDYFRQAAAHYLTALSRYFPAEELVVKDASQGETARRVAAEGRSILAKVGPRDLVVALDEKGRSLTSPELARQLGRWIEDPGAAPCFVVGGPYGLSSEVLGAARFTLGLGPGTLPHELARVVLLEQLYRAASILRGSPYHHP